MPQSRGHEALRRHRVSLPGASYFLTLCIEPRRPILTHPETAAAIQHEITSLEHDGHWAVRGAVIMPDHIHMLVALGQTLALGKTIARLKTKTRGTVSAAGARWQDNYFEHRLRPDEPVEEVLRYLHLNPYRAGLLSAQGVYPHFWLGSEEEKWFRPLLDDERPFAEWLR